MRERRVEVKHLPSRAINGCDFDQPTDRIKDHPEGPQGAETEQDRRSGMGSGDDVRRNVLQSERADSNIRRSHPKCRYLNTTDIARVRDTIAARSHIASDGQSQT